MQPRALKSILTLFFFVSSLLPTSLFAATGQKAMVATAHPYATRVAVEVMRRGGNAVDAAIAAQWVLNVVEPFSSGIGGGGFFLLSEAKTKRVYAFDGREAAPAEAHAEMFLDEEGRPLPFFPNAATGGLPVGVPGTLKLLKTVHQKFSSGKFTFAQLFDPAIEIAEDGFPISSRLAHFIRDQQDRLKLFPDSKRIFMDENGSPLLENVILFQPDLAKTFRLIKKEGIPVFYEGELAQDIVNAVRNAPYHPGSMQKEDLFYYRVHQREPVRGHYRGFDILSMGPPSSGGSTLIEALHILERYNLKSHASGSAAVHLISEAQKLAFQDRNRYLADPGFVKVPLDKLLSKQFAFERGDEIQFEHAIPNANTISKPVSFESPHTSHISIVDPEGNLVSFTTTIEHVFGSAMIVPGRGFFLNNELTDFDRMPRNEKKELRANAPEGEKRPRSSMTPTLVFKEGNPFLVVGSPGGSKIIGVVLNMVINMIDFEMTLEEAIKAPRVINRDGPTELETRLFTNNNLRRALAKRGHPVTEIASMGNVQAIWFNPETDALVGESDPRGEGEAKGF